ncbi:MAG TPA: histidine kinase [Puia sp.]|jgi:two-component system LytT family sensor kinase|nr:histidine kinase [Puia sp.]
MKLWYNRRVIRVLTHVAVWAVALSLPYLLDSHHGVHRHENDALERSFFYLNSITSLLWIGPFYLNAYLFMPRFFYRRQYLVFAAVLALAFLSVMVINMLLFEYVFEIPHYNPKGAIAFLMPAFVLITAVSTAYRVVRDKMAADELAHQRQEENLKTELSFLRSQINPHFIFNILNNLVALDQMKSPELGPTILKLSALMQYMLYETDEEKVPLNKEVEYLQSYIDLQRQRFGAKVPVTVSLDCTPCVYEIEPMLLIPFVENAFKHGVGVIEHPAIGISLEVKEGILLFSVRNRWNPDSSEVRDKGSGIGLGNVSRRLRLLYGNRHALQIRKEEDWFIVKLELNLH